MKKYDVIVEEFKHLPNIFQEIIRHQRELEDLCCQPIVSFAEFKEMKERSAELVRHVTREWKPVGGNNDLP